MATVEERLDRLERQNRWLRGIVGLCAAGMVVTLAVRLPEMPSAMAQDAPRQVAASEFLLVDRLGATRGEFYIDDFGQPNLSFWARGVTKGAQMTMTLDPTTNAPTLIMGFNGPYPALFFTATKSKAEGLMIDGSGATVWSAP